MSKLNAGLDVSLELASACGIDGDGHIVDEFKAPSGPEFVNAALP
jgi:hypothetical protein